MVDGQLHCSRQEVGFEIAHENQNKNSDEIEKSKKIEMELVHPHFDTDISISLFQHCSWRASCAGDVLDGRLMVARKHRVREVELVTNTLIFTFCRSTIKTFLIAAGVLLLFYCFIAARTYLSYPYPAAQLNSIKIDRSQVSSFSVKVNSSAFSLITGCQDIIDNESSVALERPVTVLGFRIDLNTSGCIGATSFFQIKGSTDGGKTFGVVGASGFRWILHGLRFVDRGIVGCPSSVSYDYQRPWPQHFSDESVLFLFVSGCALLGAAVCTMFSLQSAAKSILVPLLLALTLIQFVSFVGFCSLSMLREAFYPGCCCPGYALLALALAFRDRWLCESMLASGLFFLAARAVNDCVVFEDCAYLASNPPVVQAALAAAGARFVWLRRVIVREIMDGVAIDFTKFCHVWKQMVAMAENRQPLARLQQLTDAVSVRDAARPRQFNRVRASGRTRQPSFDRACSDGSGARKTSAFRSAFRAEPEGATFEVPATLPATHGDPVRSVCQLYSQALCVAPLLFSACSDWAARSGGRLDRYQVDYTPSRLFPETLQRWMLAGVIKEPGRAIAKLLACYDGDVSCLLDVCRCRIVFDSVAGMARCLEVVAGPGPARVVRVKNGLAAGHDAAESGGFRAVVRGARFIFRVFAFYSPTLFLDLTPSRFASC